MYFRFCVLLLLIFSACKSLQPVSLKNELAQNQPFSVKGDSSASIANKPWQEFFQDATLRALIEEALRNNQDLKIAMQRMEGSRAEVLLARGQFLPGVQGVASAGMDRYGDFTMNGVGNFDTNLSPNVDGERRIPTEPTPDFFVGFRSSWQIDLWGKLRQQKKSALQRFMASEEFKKLVTTEIVAQVAMLYYELLATDSELQVVQKNIRLQEQALELIELQKSVGKTTELSVQQSRALLLRTKSIAFEFQRELVALEYELNVLLGRYPQSIARGDSLLKQNLPGNSPIGQPSQMLQRRPDVQMAYRNLEASQADVRSAQLAFIPSLNIAAYLGYNAFAGNLLLQPASLTYGLLGGLAAPLFNNNQLKSQKRQRIAQAYESLYHYQQTLLRAYGEVDAQVRNLDNLEQMYQLRAEEVRILEEAVITSQSLFATGYANYLEVITAQKSALEAEISIFEIRKQQFNTSIALYKALGGGW
jgi:NodT family efflux transporter outer membrane factor (OMF) lipoprotein